MASDSASPSATQEPMEKKVTDEKMEKETGIVDVVKDKPASDSIQIVVKEEHVDQILIDYKKLAAESKNESPVVVVEEVVAVEITEESAGKGKDEKEPRDMVLKECVEEVNDEAFDEEKAEKNETVEDVAEESKEKKYVETAEKEDVKIVDVSESTDEAGGKHEDEIKDVEAVSAHVKIETTEVKAPEVESKPEASESKESASEVEVKAEENSETKEEAEVELQVKVEEKITVETKCPEDVVLISQELVSEPKKDSEEVASLYAAGFIEKISAEVKDLVEETSKYEQENESKDKDVLNKPLEEDESIKEDTLKQADTESKEKEIAATIQEEMITEKVADALETEPEVKESQEAEIRAKEVGVKPKNSNNILSKVKQSLVKAKQAFIGKSPSSKRTKTISTEAKEEIKVK